MPDTWITPRIWTVGERVGQSKINEISNNLRVLYPYTTGGDISYRDPAGDYLSRLAKGTAYQNLRMNSGATIPEWGGYIAGMVYRGTTQSITTGLLTKVQFASATISRLVTWTSGDNTKLTIGATGLYLIGFMNQFDDNGGSGYRGGNIKKNNSSNILESRVPYISGDDVFPSSSGLALLTSGDYLQLEVSQNSGSSMNLLSSYLFAAFLGA